MFDTHELDIDFKVYNHNMTLVSKLSIEDECKERSYHVTRMDSMYSIKTTARTHRDIGMKNDYNIKIGSDLIDPLICSMSFSLSTLIWKIHKHCDLFYPKGSTIFYEHKLAQTNH